MLGGLEKGQMLVWDWMEHGRKYSWYKWLNNHLLEKVETLDTKASNEPKIKVGRLKGALGTMRHVTQIRDPTWLMCSKEHYCAQTSTGLCHVFALFFPINITHLGHMLVSQKVSCISSLCCLLSPNVKPPFPY